MKGSLILRTIVAVAVLALAGGGGYWAWRARHPAKSLFRTGTVIQGNLVATITATGTVEPEVVVDVGAQVSGQFLEFGKDENGKPVDYGSVVKSNMLLARIDTNLFQADVDLDTAVVASDKAGEAQAAANVKQMEATEAQAEADWKRAQMLGPSGEALAPSTYDSYKANYEIAKAKVDVAIAALASAKAATRQAEANLRKAQRNLDYCTISSPVDGVIIDRRVNIGQTVASSLNTPSLFLIAEKLTSIQVWASVNEADIGSIHPGQAATFTVDAYPRVFKGTVNKVRLNATMTQNVVTYTVEIDTENLDGKLLPYMTANVKFLTGEATNTLLVLNSALRWHPQNDLIAPEFRQPGGGAGRASAGGGTASGQSGAASEGVETAGSGSGRRGGGRGSGGQEAAAAKTGTIWTKDGTYVRPVSVKLGLTDGTWTQVQGEGVAKGAVVVTGTLSVEAAAEEVSADANPFIPQIGRRGGPGGGMGGGGGRRGGG